MAAEPTAKPDAPGPRSAPRANGLLKMSELAERSGVSAGTIKHYLREGLLGGDDEITRTSRNMAYYPPEFVERIAVIKRLQEQRFMPLRVIRELLREDPQRLEALIELEDRILDRATAAAGERTRTSRTAVERAYDVPRNVLERLEQLEVLTPTTRGYDADDVKIIEAISRFRAGGYDEAIGFTVYDTLRYREALTPLVEEEVRVLLGRLAPIRSSSGSAPEAMISTARFSSTEPARRPSRTRTSSATSGVSASR